MKIIVAKNILVTFFMYTLSALYLQTYKTDPLSQTKLNLLFYFSRWEAVLIQRKNKEYAFQCDIEFVKYNK